LHLDKRKLLAFHEKNIDSILDKLGLLEKIKKGEIKCVICNKVITKKNLGAILKRNDKLLIICDSLECLEKIKSE